MIHKKVLMDNSANWSKHLREIENVQNGLRARKIISAEDSKEITRHVERGKQDSVRAFLLEVVT